MRFSRAQLGAGAAMFVAAGLVGCNNGGEGGRLALTGSSYCTPFRTAANTNATSGQSGLAAPAGDAATAFDDCVHRWAYAMAPARDPADIVAHAVVDACGEAMNAWNQQASTTAQAPTQNPNGPDQGYQNGQDQGGPGGPQGYGPPPGGGRGGADQQQQMQQMQNSPMAQHMQIAEARSLFYVIQARSAGCAPPPANTLVSRPAG